MSNTDHPYDCFTDCPLQPTRQIIRKAKKRPSKRPHPFLRLGFIRRVCFPSSLASQSSSFINFDTIHRNYHSPSLFKF